MYKNWAFEGQSQIAIGHRFCIFCFTGFFSQQVRVEGRNKTKHKIHLDHFPIAFDFNWKMVPMNFIFILPIKMAIFHQVLSLGVI